ncbi:MAG: ribosome maturation factor RimM [Vulcanimicrobiaceae bacterium]
MKCVPTASGEHAFASGTTFAIGNAADAREVRCTGARRHHEKLLVAFADIATPEAARAFVGAELYGEAGAIVLAPGEYLDADLVGMRLVDLEGRELATVVGVQHFPAQDCLIVGERRALVPMVKAFIRRIDAVARSIEVDLPLGLIED